MLCSVVYSYIVNLLLLSNHLLFALKIWAGTKKCLTLDPGAMEVQGSHTKVHACMGKPECMECPDYSDMYTFSSGHQCYLTVLPDMKTA